MQCGGSHATIAVAEVRNSNNNRQTATRQQRGRACSVLKRTAFSPRSARARPGALLDQGLSGEGMRGPLMDLYGAAADAGTAGVGTVHVGERLSRNRALRRSLQLVPVPGELLRPRALRVDARQLEPSAERQ